MLFCQREAAETAIFLAEVAARHGTPDYRPRLDERNQLHNSGLPRIGLKMATGSGKTVVMAMLIAWQTANKVFTGDVRSRDTDRIALWMIDTAYNEESFFVRHCYFTYGDEVMKVLEV